MSRKPRKLSGARHAPGILLCSLWCCITFVIFGYVIAASFSTTKDIFQGTVLQYHGIFSVGKNFLHGIAVLRDIGITFRLVFAPEQKQRVFITDLLTLHKIFGKHAVRAGTGGIQRTVNILCGIPAGNGSLGFGADTGHTGEIRNVFGRVSAAALVIAERKEHKAHKIVRGNRCSRTENGVGSRIQGALYPDLGRAGSLV